MLDSARIAFTFTHKTSFNLHEYGSSTVVQVCPQAQDRLRHRQNSTARLFTVCECSEQQVGQRRPAMSLFG